MRSTGTSRAAFGVEARGRGRLFSRSSRRLRQAQASRSRRSDHLTLLVKKKTLSRRDGRDGRDGREREKGGRFCCSCSATGGSAGERGGEGGGGGGGDSKWKEKYDKAVNEDLPKFWQDFQKKASLKLEVLADDVNRSFGKLNRKFKIGNKADSFKREVQLQFEALDNRFGLTTKVQNAVEQFRRNYPELKRKFTVFSNTTTGKVVLYGAFIYLIFSGIYLKILYFIFLLSLFSPLLLPFLQQLIIDQQEKQAREAYENQSWFDRVRSQYNGGQQQQYGGRPQQRQKRKPQQPSQDDDFGSIIDAEWTTIDDDDK